MLGRFIVSGVALVVAALLVPGIEVRWGKEPLTTLISVSVLGVIFGLVNAYLKPILKLVSLPLNFLSLGLFSFVVNAGLLLLVAWLADRLLDPPPLRLGGYPPDLDAAAIGAAVLGSIVVSVASTVMSLLTPDA
jgi:putative membrane protein